MTSTVAASAQAPRRRPCFGMAASRPPSAMRFVLPTLAILLVFRFVPMLEAFCLSLTKYDLDPSAASSSGWRTSSTSLHDPLFLQSARVSIAYVVFSVVPVWPLSLGLAMLFNRGMLLKNVLRSAVFMPVVMPAVVMAVVWTFMYQQDGVHQHDAGLVRRRSRAVAAQQLHRAVGRDPDRHLARHALLHGDLPRRPAGHPDGLLRRRQDRRRRRLERFSGTSRCRS